MNPLQCTYVIVATTWYLTSIGRDSKIFIQMGINDIRKCFKLLTYKPIPESDYVQVSHSKTCNTFFIAPHEEPKYFCYDSALR